MPYHEYRTMRTTYYGPVWDKSPVPENAKAYLTTTAPRLVKLRERYRGHPASSNAQWDEMEVLTNLKLDDFRGDNHYVYQVRYSPRPETYHLTAYYVRNADRLGLFGRLVEDGLFGAYTLPFEEGYVISRDLLESINEINFIARMLGKGREDGLRVLDIGAGYGRLAHRLCEALPHVEVACADAVPISTFLCEFYLRYRGYEGRTSVIPLDEVASRLDGRSFDAVTNIHSFSECSSEAIDWWLGAMDRIEVRYLLIIPNARDQFLSTERDGRHLDFLGLIKQHGWRIAHKEPIYAKSEVAQKFALYPNFCFYWFERC
jgi:hypothetical protein